MKHLLFTFLAFMLCFPASAEDGLKYYMDFDTALKNTPKKETEFFSKELGRDFTNWPQPWNIQIRNAITNAGGSDRQTGTMGGKKYWIPFDPIPGEANFPMMKRLNLNAQRGYQRAIIHDMVELEAMDKEFSTQIKTIVDKYKADSEKSMQTVLDSGNALKQKMANERASYEALKKKEAFYEKECADFFPDDAGGCSTIAFSIVNGSVNKTRPLKSSANGGKIRKGDVFLATPKGRLVVRDDQGGWVEWFKYDDVTADVPSFSRAI